MALDVRYAYRTLLVNEDEFSEQIRKALAFLIEAKSSSQIGDYLEFGVCHGTSMICVHKEMQAAGVADARLIGFDSFEGLPDDDEGYWNKGAFKSDMDHTRHVMTEGGVDWARTHLVQGWFSDTLNAETIRQHNMRKISIANIDCDIHSAAKEALDFCGPLFDDLVILNFDDWNPLAKENKGEKRAFDEFLAENPQFEAEPFGEYSYKPGDLHGKLFVLRQT